MIASILSWSHRRSARLSAPLHSALVGARARMQGDSRILSAGRNDDGAADNNLYHSFNFGAGSFHFAAAKLCSSVPCLFACQPACRPSVRPSLPVGGDTRSRARTGESISPLPAIVRPSSASLAADPAIGFGSPSLSASVARRWTRRRRQRLGNSCDIKPASWRLEAAVSCPFAVLSGPLANTNCCRRNHDNKAGAKHLAT